MHLLLVLRQRAVGGEWGPGTVRSTRALRRCWKPQGGEQSRALGTSLSLYPYRFFLSSVAFVLAVLLCASQSS